MSSQVRALGSNGSGQLGIGHEEDVSTPTECLFEDATPNFVEDQRNDAFAAGGNHTLLLDREHRAWASGDNRNGRCGIPDKFERFNTFHQVCFPDENGDIAREFCGVSATWEASTFVSRDGNNVYTCGSGQKGELGLGDSVVEASHPKLLRDFPPEGTEVVQISASMEHTAAVLDDGSVYGWGNGRKRRLGSAPEPVWSPRRIENIDFEVRKAQCGREFTYVVGEPGSLMQSVIGGHKWAVRGNVPLMPLDRTHFATSWFGVYILYDGKLLNWGRSDHGQLAPLELPALVGLAAGSEHVLVMSWDGDILAWGWGEHGNCGSETLPNGDVKGRWNVIATSGRAVLGAGCATSFIAVKKPT